MLNKKPCRRNTKLEHADFFKLTQKIRSLNFDHFGRRNLDVYHKLADMPLEADKPLHQNLSKIFRISKKRAYCLCAYVGMPPILHCKFLSNTQANKLNHLLSKKFVCGKDLKASQFNILQKLRINSTSKSLRLAKGLPVRGQRTHGNAKTARKKLYSVQKR